MMINKPYQLPNTTNNHALLNQLIMEKYYVGEISQRSFIIKRNFGIRRLTLYGEFKLNVILIEAKNEILHQVFLILGVALIFGLIAFSLYQGLYWVAFFLSIIFIFLILDNRHRIQKEYQLLEDTLRALEEC